MESWGEQADSFSFKPGNAAWVKCATGMTCFDKEDVFLFFTRAVHSEEPVRTWRPQNAAW